MKWNLFSLWSEPMSEATNTVTAEPKPVTSPASDKAKAVLDATFEAAKVALRHRPIALMTVVAADAIIDALWDKIFPPAQAALTAKGVSV